MTGVLLEHEGNIEDSSMTILGGQFAMVLLVDAPAQPEVLERDLAATTADLGLVVAVRAVGQGALSAGPTHVLSVYGGDRRGLVHAASTALADLGCNVTDLETRVLGVESPVYAMVFEVMLPDGVAPDVVAARVRSAAEGLEVSIHELDAAAF